MEEEGWKKDEKPYLVFACSKCKQYLYVKTTQKGKKCLRCGHQHKVTLLINSGEVIKGMTTAVKLVQTRQNELALQELGSAPELRAGDEFIVQGKFKKSYNEISKFCTNHENINADELAHKFKEMIYEISDSYSQFPFYILEIMAENYQIPLKELKFLLKNSEKEGFVIRSEDNLYKINI
ncbi:MAG: hypothetical protein ACW98D_11250 [Promethearchaeota archaeon]